jgi:MoaA/NifB/PqqE/SkfB family radical SAM enzyme
MCFQRDDQGILRVETKDQELKPSQWKLIIDRIARFSSSTLWMGGEIFVYPSIIDLLAYTRAKGLQIMVLTNGYYLADVAEQLVEIGIDKLCVSIDGLEQAHNTVRRNRQSFARAVEGVKAVYAARETQQKQVPIIHINHVITRQNYLDLPAFVTFAADLGADVVEFLGLTYLLPAEAQQNSHILHREFGVTANKMDVLYNGEATGLDAPLLQQQLDSFLPTAPPQPVLRFYPEGLENHIEWHYGLQTNLATPPQQHCAGVWRRMVIQPNGDVAVCYNQPELVMGNVLHQELSTIWAAKKFLQFRQRLRQKL